MADAITLVRILDPVWQAATVATAIAVLALSVATVIAWLPSFRHQHGAPR